MDPTNEELREKVAGVPCPYMYMTPGGSLPGSARRKLTDARIDALAEGRSDGTIVRLAVVEVFPLVDEPPLPPCPWTGAEYLKVFRAGAQAERDRAAKEKA